MKFTPEVIAAIQTLRDNAENDFERHRIDVLEQDLTAPPQVEVIDDTHQRFNGVVYHAIKKEGHYKGDVRLHRVVYEYYVADIPDNYDIHHIDRNKANNTAENLQCLSKSEHRKIHHEEDTKIITCIHCGKKFVVEARTDNNGYCSDNCRISHKFRDERNQEVRVCERCGGKFSTYKYGSARFCSDVCRYADVQILKKVCPVCGKNFETFTWHEKNCCSHRCASKLMWQTKRAGDKAKSRKCAFCGKDFPVKKPTQRFCSKSCAMRYRYRKN